MTGYVWVLTGKVSSDDWMGMGVDWEGLGVDWVGLGVSWVELGAWVERLVSCWRVELVLGWGWALKH